MLIAIELTYLALGVGIPAMLMFVFAYLYLSLNKKLPDIKAHTEAIEKNKSICRVHYAGRKCADYIATVDKLEGEIGTPYWTVPQLGIKFKPEADQIEFIEGSVRCVNYFENMLEAQKTDVSVAFSQMKDYFKKIGCPIDSIEDVAFLVAAENEKLGDSTKAIKNSKINSKETEKYVRRYLDAIKAHKVELEKIKLQSGVFTYQTSIKALDSMVAFTSAHAAHMKEVIKAAVMRQEDQKRKDYIMYAIIAFILAMAGGVLLKLSGAV